MAENSPNDKLHEAERLAAWLESVSDSYDPVGPEYRNAANLLRELASSSELETLRRELAIADEHARDYQAEIAALLGNGSRPSDDTEKSLLRRTIRELETRSSASAPSAALLELIAKARRHIAFKGAFRSDDDMMKEIDDVLSQNGR